MFQVFYPGLIMEGGEKEGRTYPDGERAGPPTPRTMWWGGAVRVFLG